jgi:hypothetical protein
MAQLLGQVQSANCFDKGLRICVLGNVADSRMQPAANYLYVGVGSGRAGSRFMH